MTELSSLEVDALNRVRRAFAHAPRGTFVIAGGWAARLLRSHPLARTLPFDALFTQDLDVAVPNERQAAPGQVGDELLREGFKREFRSEDRPPVTLYSLDQFDLEFIAPWVPRRADRNSITVEVHGAIAQTAKHVEILLFEPCELEVPLVGAVVVASPSSYLIQKALSLWERRSLQKMGKDAVYLWEVLALFSEGPRLHACRQRRDRDPLSARSAVTRAPGAGVRS